MSKFDDIVSKRTSESIKKIVANEIIEEALWVNRNRIIRRVEELEDKIQNTGKSYLRKSMCKTLGLNRLMLETVHAIKERKYREQREERNR